MSYLHINILAILLNIYSMPVHQMNECLGINELKSLLTANIENQNSILEEKGYFYLEKTRGGHEWFNERKHRFLHINYQLGEVVFVQYRTSKECYDTIRDEIENNDFNKDNETIGHGINLFFSNNDYGIVFKYSTYTSNNVGTQRFYTVEVMSKEIYDLNH